MKPILPGLYALPLGAVNVFLLDGGDGLTLIDTGYAGSAPRIGAALEALGRRWPDVRRILLTHCHPDHAGGLAEVKRLSGAPASLHPLDAALVRAGQAGRGQMTVAPGMLNRVLYRLFIAGATPTIEAAEIERTVDDGDGLPDAGGLRVVFTPGHSAGHVAYLWEKRGVLFAGDVASHVAGLQLSIAYEDLDLGKRSLEKLARLEFEAACFGHGGPVLRGAAAQFRRKWG